MKTLFAVICIVLLAGCAGLQGGSNMSPEQLKAVAGDKNAGVFCNKGVGAGWITDSMFVSFDKSTVSNGGLTAKCGESTVSITTEATPAKATPVVKP